MATWERLAKQLESRYATFVALTAHTLFLISAMSCSWPSPILPKLLEAIDSPFEKPITPNESDLIAAIFYIGAAIGPLCCIFVVNYFGRKNVLIALSLIPPTAYGTMVYAKSVTLFYICRVFLGLYVGSVFSIQPVYLSEVLPKSEREFLMSFVTLFSFIGVFATVAIGPFVTINNFNGIITVLSVIALMLVFFGFPDSPYYVMETEGRDKTKELLEKMRTGNVNEELDEIEQRVFGVAEKSGCKSFCNIQTLKNLILATIPLLLQSTCGIALLINNSQLIFMETNIAIPSHYCSIILVGLTFFTAFLAPVLLKRNISPITLLMMCLTGICTCDLLMGLYFISGKEIPYVSWLPLLILVVFVVIYNCGLDSIPWMILGNTYPVSFSAVGTAISISLFELSIFPLMFIFHKIAISYLFIISGAFCALGIVYVKLVIQPSEDKIFNKTSKNGVV